MPMMHHQLDYLSPLTTTRTTPTVLGPDGFAAGVPALTCAERLPVSRDDDGAALLVLGQLVETCPDLAV